MSPSEPVKPEFETTPAPLPATSSVAPDAQGANPAPKIVGYCRECGKALDESNVRPAFGTIYCEEHQPSQPVAEHGGSFQAASSPVPPPLPYTAPVFHASHSAYYGTQPPYGSQQPAYGSQPPAYGSQQPALPAASPLNACGSPALAFLLGMIPGVGAVYNGQYAKGLMHVVIFGLAISLAHNGPSEFEPLFGLLVMCFWFYMAFEAYHTAKKRQAGLPLDEFSSVFPLHGRAAHAPIGPIVLIALGVLFLLTNLEIIDMRRLLRFWPALLIVMGLYMIYTRLGEAGGKRNGR